MENMENYNKLRTPPGEVLKKITGGRLKGMTDINPQWRIQVMTEVYGQCGIGWKFEIEKLWTEPGDNGQVAVFALVQVYTKTDEKWNNPIPGIGGSKLITGETKGLYTNDEAYKMAVTDALGTALKMLGVAADIYGGLWDGSKYKDTSPATTPNPVSKIDQAIKDKIASLKTTEELKTYYNDNKHSYKTCQKEFHSLIEAQNNIIIKGHNNGNI
jgi:hypothetical protein